jgi:pimeloyl-ACP methyl ester carboxylesterase
MSRTIVVDGRNVEIAEAGSGAPLLYLHGFADIHGAHGDWMPFHTALARDFHVIAPAHPGCGETAEDDSAETVDDLVFHYLQVIDALGLTTFHLAGSSVGGWIAAEIAVRHPEKIIKLALLGAAGLFVPGEPIGDVFMMVQAENGTQYRGLRQMLFRAADSAEANDVYPDGIMPVERETRRYRTFRFASRFGFSPPYFYSAKLRRRLPRFNRPALIVAGEQDNFVPRTHAEAYAAGLPQATLQIVAGAGNSIIAERGGEAATLVRAFLR